MQTDIFSSLIYMVLIFAGTLILVPLNIRISKRFKLLDYPTESSIHKEVRPLCGGFSIGVTVLAGMIIYNLTRPADMEFPNLMFMLIGSSGILIAGFFDDKYRLSASWKLLFQIVVAIFMFWGGFRINLLTNPWNDAISLGFASFPFTILWFVLIINAFNLIDGIDGLATGITVIVSAVLIVIGFRYNNPFLYHLAIFLFASSLAFLIYNFPPAKIFLGDTGSQFLGFYVAAISIAGNAQFKGITAMTLLIPILVMFIPLADTLLAILRRIKYRKGIFTRDQHHLHHKMLRLGLSPRVINYIFYTITFLFGMIAIGFSFADKNLLFTILIGLSLIVFVMLYIIAKKELRK